MHTQIAHGHLVDLRDAEHALDLVAHGLRNAEDLRTSEADRPRTPAVGLSLGKSILHLGDDVKLTQQGGLESARHARQMPKSLEATQLEAFLRQQTIPVRRRKTAATPGSRETTATSSTRLQVLRMKNS